MEITELAGTKEARAPVVQVIEVVVWAVTVQGTLSNSTATSAATAEKPVPVIVTSVPPAAVPWAGEMAVTFGVTV